MNETITTLKGVGKKIELLLEKLGISTIGDLVNHYPRRYEDYSKLQKIGDLAPGPVTLEVEIESVSGRYARRGLHITEAILSDDTGSVKAVWFNQPYRSKQLHSGTKYFCSGKYEFSNYKYSILNPSLEKTSDFPVNVARVVPIYPETKGLKSHQLRKLLAQVDFEALGDFEELPYPTDLSRKQAIKLMHFPTSTDELERAQEYFEFEELFMLVLSSALIRQANTQMQAPPLKLMEKEIKAMVDGLPFKLTDAQRRVAWKSFLDMEKSSPMNRLIEGDVGSGKTVVAAMLAYNAVLGGQQAAFMAPTEVLAAQHFTSLEKLLSDTEVKVGLYTGSMTAKLKNETKEKLKAGDINLVVGTHSLIQKGVEFRQLGLVVIDEQHRFGVKQRAELSAQTTEVPHILSMTATPIPRTLALTVFGDLDISVIDEMPKGRKRIVTKLVAPNSRKSVHERVKKELDAGRQAFIIYPLIQESEKLDLKSAEVEYEKLSKSSFKQYRVGLLHGKMKADLKNQIMQDFSVGKLDVLVSTTVIEVGVDVPNATVMVIEGAERFGLAQLHQLRGRVGRGEHQAYCILIPTNSQTGKQRLKALETMHDGFALAEYDLELRGPGAIYGTSQHGELDINFTKLNDPKKIARAQDIVDELIQKPDQLVKYPGLMNKTKQYRAVTHLN